MFCEYSVKSYIFSNIFSKSGWCKRVGERNDRAGELSLGQWTRKKIIGYTFLQGQFRQSFTYLSVYVIYTPHKLVSRYLFY